MATRRNRDYAVEYARRKERAAERGFRSFYQQRQAGPGAAVWADDIAAGRVESDVARTLIDAGVTNPNDISNLELTINAENQVGITFTIQRPDGTVEVIEVPAGEILARDVWSQLWVWAEEHDIDTEVTYEG